MGAEQQNKGAGGSRLAAACGLMPQYMKEKAGCGGGGGRGAAVTMHLMPGGHGVDGAEDRIRRTMELFPQQPGRLRDNSLERRILEPDRAQLTIFYGGRTIVFDDFPADKADELLQLAGSFVAPAASDDEPVCQNAPAQHFLADMPIAKKASLQRFLQKRKSRLAAADPYPLPLVAPKETGKPAEHHGAAAPKETGKPAEHHGAAPWLGFNCELHLN